MMKRSLLGILIFFAASLVRAQNVRYDAPFPSVSSSTATPYLVANVPPNSPVLAVCHSPANQLPCTNYATTYTSLGAACPNGSQDTPQPQPSSCQTTGDAQGNIGFWAPPGTYDYTVCIGINCFGPYTVTIGGGTAGVFGLTPNASGVPAPGTITSPACGTIGTPFAYYQKSDGTWQDSQVIDEVASNGVGAPGTWTWCYRTFWNDSGVAMPNARNGLVGINHYWGNGGVTATANDDRAFIIVSTNGGSLQSFPGNQLLAQYNEMDLAGTPTLSNFTSVGDNDLASSGRFNMTDKRTGGTAIASTWGGLQGVHALFDMDTASSGLYASGCSNGLCAAGLRASFFNLLAGDFANSEFSAGLFLGGNRTTTAGTSLGFSNVHVIFPGTNSSGNYGRFPNFNYGIHVDNFGTNSADYNFVSEGVNADGTPAGYLAMVGPVVMGAKAQANSGMGLDVRAGAIQTNANLFSKLPTCSSTTEGAFRGVTDSSTNTWGATITGSSTNHVLAYCDGTNWTVAAK